MLSSPVEKTKQIEQSTTESSNKEYTIFENEQKMQPIYMNRQFNTGSINIWVSDRLFYIQPKNQTTGIGTIIKVDRATQNLSQLGRQQYQFDRVREQTSRKQDMLTDQKRFKKMQKLDYSLLIGIIDLSQVKLEKQPDVQTNIKKPKKVLFLAETVQLVCTINHRNIYKILKPVYIFFDPKDKQKLCDEQASLLLNLNLFFEQGMYYSYTYDLSKPMRQDPIVKHDINRQSMQTYSMENRQFYCRCSLGQKVLSKAKMQQLVQENKDPIKVRLSQKQEKQTREQNNQFNWAQYLQKQLQNFDQRWRTAIIQGFVGKMQVHVKAEKFKLVLLTRRNRMNGGPLQFATGFTKLAPSSTESKTTTNQNAKTANYTETQFIFHIKKYYYSFVQVRGTIPLHWKFKYSYGMVSGVEFEKTIQQNYRDFIQHFNDVRNKHGYDYVGMLNLLNSKGSQTKLIQNLQYIVKKCQNLPGLTYKYFDMHNRCPHKNFTKLTQFLIFELQPLLNKCSFSVFEVQASSTGPSIANKPRTLLQIHKQKGVIRTNCGTCIDRSNIVQSRIAALQLVYMLQTLDIKIHGISDTLHFIQDETPFAKLYRNMWADNGDAISQQYSGTSSMESVTVRMGKISYLASIDHGLTSLYRIVRNLREQDSGKWKAVYFLQQTKNETQHEKGNRNSMKTEQNSSSEYMH